MTSLDNSSGRMSRHRLCFVMTAPFALNAFLLPHLRRLVEAYDITVCVNTGDSAIAPVLPAGVRLESVPIAREIDVVADLRALSRLVGLFRRQGFDLVFSLTPKGGLLAMLAARLAGVPVRIHCFTGQVWATLAGFNRCLFKTLDRLLAACATGLLADSRSQRQFLVDEGIVGPEKIRVLAEGSIAGVDTERFCPNEELRRVVRGELGIDEADCCLLYVGRLKREKGVADLVRAFAGLAVRYPRLHLLLVGPDEEDLAEGFADLPRLHRVGYTSEVPRYMAAADGLCLPSYREGFGLVLIEAGAAGLPVVASRIYGITDAVVEGETGLLHRPGDVADLERSLAELVEDKALRDRLGAAGRRRAVECFRDRTVTEAMAGFIGQTLAGGFPSPPKGGR